MSRQADNMSLKSLMSFVVLLSWGLLYADTAVGYHQTGGANVPAGETVAQTNEVLLGDGGAFCKIGDGALDMSFSKIDRQVGGWAIRNHAGTLRLAAGDDTTAASVPSVIREKAALWLRTDSAIVTNGTGGTVQYVKQWIDVRDLEDSSSPQHVYATPAWGSLSPEGSLECPPVLVEKDGVAALYFGGNESGKYLRFSSEVSNIRQSFVVHGVYQCWGAVLGNTARRKAMIPAVDHGSVAVSNLVGHFAQRTELSSAYSAARAYLDGELFDPYTVPPYRGFQLLEFEFPCQRDSVNAIFRSGFETVVNKTTGDDIVIQGGDYVSEIVLFTNVVSEVERLEVERYLMRRWSLPRPAERPVAHLPAAGTVSALSNSVVELTAAAGETLPLMNLCGNGTIRKLGAGTLDLGPTDGSPFSGTFLWEAGSILSRGGRPPAVTARSGDSFDGSVYTPYEISAAREELVDINGGALLTRTTDAGPGRVVKTGNDWVRVNEMKSDVRNLEVNQGVLSLESKTHVPADGRDDLALSVTVPNADFEKSFTVTGSAGRGLIGGSDNVQNGWTGTAYYISSAGDGSAWMGNVPAPSGSQVLLLQMTSDASTTVTLPADGWYELTLRAKSRYGAASSRLMYIDQVEVLFGPDAANLKSVGCLWPSSLGYGRYAFRLPYSEKGSHVLKIASTRKSYDAAVLVDDVEIRAIPWVTEETVFKVPNGDFERLEEADWGTDRTGAWTGILSAVDNLPTGWTFDVSQSSYPSATTNGAVGVVSPAISPSGSAAMACGLGNLLQGSSRLFFFNQGGRASTTFTIPAGRYRLRADMARFNLAMAVDGTSEKTCSAAATFAASVSMGEATVDLGSIRRDDFLAKKSYLPNDLIVSEAQEVTLTISQTTASGSGWVDNLEFVSVADYAEQENLLKNPGAEENQMANWIRSADTSLYSSSTAWIREYDKGDTTKNFGYSAFEGDRYFFIRNRGTMSQQVTIPEAGLYRFTCHVRTRADSVSYSGNNLRVWCKEANGSATNVIDTILMNYMGNYLERAWLVRFDAAGVYELGISGLTEAASEREAHLDGLSLRKVAGTVEAVPQASKELTISIAEGARLVLNFPGVRKVRSLILGGVKQSSGIVGASDHPDYIGGIGRLEIAPCGLLLILK